MSIDRQADLKASLALLQRVLVEEVGALMEGGRRSKVSLRQALLKKLRKQVVGGDAKAFALLRVLKRRESVREAVLKSLALGPRPPHWPIIQGGVFHVPWGISSDQVDAMLNRGITKQDFRTLMAARKKYSSR